ncbi:MAG: polysaccharide deacetylase family protein [Akkermansiaceae bacterium]
MKSFLTALVISLFSLSAYGQDPSEVPAQPPQTPSAPSTPAPAVETPPIPQPTVDDGVRVTVLGYHDFTSSETIKPTEMLIHTAKFRKQMQAIKDLGLTVISLDDFIAWKRGKKQIKDKSVLITIDDGWKSVYTDAYPILKEFGYPFSIYLYTNYVDGGGRALTSPMIKEMMKNGCTIGSHSVSHPYPSVVKKKRAEGAEPFTKFLQVEFGQSRKILESKFSEKVITYVYPGGFYTGEMFPVAGEAGYEFLFTCDPEKTTRATPNYTIPRYIIQGKPEFDYIFRNATSFKATSTSAATDGAIVQSTEHPVTPLPGALTPDRLPLISADLSKVENLDVESIVMRVAGFGKVPATYDNQTKTVSWKVNRRLRSRTCEVTVQWRIKGAKQFTPPMNWIFRINREAAYQPKNP